VATLFNWNVAAKGEPPKYDSAAITISDRMITAGDVQYEPNQQKVAFISPRVLLMIAGDTAIHSQALRDLRTHVTENTSAYEVATVYGRMIQALKHREAESLILAPLGLNSDTFLAQQREMSDGYANSIKLQLQEYRGADVEALVVGSSSSGPVQLYYVDERGLVSCMDDIGFAAIGIGAWHAKSRLMQVGYASATSFAPALALTFAAKKTAETAPGVGGYSDIHIVFKGSILPLWQDVRDALEEIYRTYVQAQRTVAGNAIAALDEYLRSKVEQEQPPSDAEKEGKFGRDAPSDGSATAPTAEAPPGNEAGTGKTGI
jgi:20S proteasome alpha/beta subunit